MKNLILVFLCFLVVFHFSLAPVVHADSVPLPAGLSGYKIVEIIGAMMVYLASMGVVLESADAYNNFFYQQVQSNPEAFQEFAIGAFEAKDDQELMSRIRSRGSARGYHVTGDFISINRQKIDEVISNYSTDSLSITRSNDYTSTKQYRNDVFRNVFFNFKSLSLPVYCAWNISRRTDIETGFWVSNQPGYFTISDGYVRYSFDEDAPYYEAFFKIPDEVGYSWSLVDLEIPIVSPTQSNDSTNQVNSIRSLCLAGTKILSDGKASTLVIALSDIYNQSFTGDESDYVRDHIFPTAAPAANQVYENTNEERPSPPSIAIPAPETVFGVNKPFAEQLLNQSAEAREQYITSMYDAISNPVRGRTAQDRARSVDENIERRKAVPDTFPNTANLPWANAYDGVTPQTDSNTNTGSNTGTQTAGLDLSVPETAELDFSPLYANDLSKIFPFSIPFDLYNFLKSFDGLGSNAPRWQFDLMGSTYVIDFAPFNEVAKAIRMMTYLGFVLSLILISRKLIGAN